MHEVPTGDQALHQGGGGHGHLAAALVQCAAFVKELETQSHLIHLNYEGGNFLSVHAFLKERYETHLQQFDTLAELVRGMDFLMPLCGCSLKEQACGFRPVEQHDGRHQLMVYLANLERLIAMATSLESMAGECCAVDVQDYAAELAADSRKNAWFLKATLRG